MKNLMFIAFGLCLLTISCDKEERDDEKSCPVVTEDRVPEAVKSAFNARYPKTTAEKWFDKNGSGFGALISLNGVKTIAEFTNDGSFVEEETNDEADEEDDDHDFQLGHHDEDDDEEEDDCDCDFN